MKLVARCLIPPLIGLSVSIMSLSTFGTSSGFSLRSSADSSVPKPVRPVLDCVTQTSDTTFTAYFGYLNPNTRIARVLIGNKNQLSPSPTDGGQPVDFLPGRQQRAFAVNVKGSKLTWYLQGRTSTANRRSKQCATEAQTTSEPDGAPKLSVFPNPADGDGFNVQLTNSRKAVPTLTTPKGQSILVRYRPICDTQLEIMPYSKLRAGTYILNVTESGITRSLKVTIR